MKTIYTTNLNVGDELTNELFLLQDVIRRTTKDDRPYLLCTVRDKTGQAGAVFWNVPEYVEEWARAGAVVLVSGRVVSYKDNLQINITDMNPGQQTNMEDLLPSSSRARSDMIAELRQQIESLDQPWRGLVDHLLLQEPFLDSFANAPAARTMHHAYIGGLLEHSLSMARLADFMSNHYPYVNRDLLVSGALVHDMGKTREYEVEGSFGLTEDGRLVGHIVRAVTMIEKGAAAINFPDQELQHLVHLVASHHGTMEWGSPVVPKTLEAILLHQIDLLDSRIQGFFDHIGNDGSSERWTTKSSLMFSTELRRPPQMPA